MIRLKIGETHKIELDENPSTGYKWNYEPSDSEYASIIKINLPLELNIIGQTHKVVFEITALKKGEEEITFKYSRDWEKDIKPISTKKINIKIK